jgi:membrane peptidoglycan carboxypeptidase
MGYTTDVAIGVWVGNTRNQQLRELDGIQGAGPIWSRTMEEIHSNPEFAKLLAGPDGQPVPEQFPRPPGIVDGVVCSATGGRPTSNGGNRSEVLVQGGAPAQRCDQLSAFHQADLEDVMRTLRSRGGRFEPGAINSIEQYARAVRNSNGSGMTYVPPEPPRNR